MVHSQGFRWFLPVQVQTSCRRDEFCLKEGFCCEFPQPKKKLKCSSATAHPAPLGFSPKWEKIWAIVGCLTKDTHSKTQAQRVISRSWCETL